MTYVFSWNNRRRARPAAGLGLLAALLLIGSAPVRAIDEEGCSECHGLPGFAVRVGDSVRPLAVAQDRFNASAHADLGCRECHASIASIPHSGERREVSCGLACHGHVTGGEEYSHEALYWEYQASAHGKAANPRLGCVVCHPTPTREEVGGRDKLLEARRCAACHRDRPAVRAWFGDRHALALARGNERAPSCPDCHSAHAVRAVRDAESPVAPERLGQTCARGALGGDWGRGCHGALPSQAGLPASMSPFPRGGGRGLSWIVTLCYGAMLAGLGVRAGIGFVRGR